MHVCFIGLRLFYRDISFLCDAMTAQKKTTLLPPLTDRSSLGDAQVSCLSLVFDVIWLKIKTSALQQLLFAGGLCTLNRDSGNANRFNKQINIEGGFFAGHGIDILVVLLGLSQFNVELHSEYI